MVFLSLVLSLGLLSRTGIAGAASRSLEGANFSAPAWTERITTLMRSYWYEQKYDEVFRLDQILRRTQKQDLESERLLRLSLFTNGNCVLSENHSDPTFSALLNAATYRYYSRFVPREGKRSFWSFLEDWDRGIMTFRVDFKEALFLSDISNAKLVRNRGCVFFRSSPPDVKEIASQELKYLRNFYERRRDLSGALLEPSPVVQAEILARILALEEVVGVSLEDQERQEIANIDWMLLAQLPDPERRFLWQKKQEIAPPDEKQQKEFLLQVLSSPDSAAVVDWLSLTDLDFVAAKTRIDIYRRFLDFRELKENDYLTLKLAQALWREGQVTAAIPLLRQLLLKNESSDFLQIRDAALQLASDVFARAQWNEKSRGAFYASLPRSTWGAYYRQLVLKLAIEGDSRHLESLMGDLKLKALVSPPLASLLKALARRQEVQFKRQFRIFFRDHRSDRTFQTWLEQMIVHAMELPREKHRELRPFYRIMAASIKDSLLNSKKSDTEALQQLLHSFSEFTKDEWIEGNGLARNGVMKMGHLTLHGAKALPVPFVFLVNKELPLRSFYYVPQGMEGRQWVIEN